MCNPNSTLQSVEFVFKICCVSSSPLLSPPQPRNPALEMKYLVFQWGGEGVGHEGEQRAAYDARTSTSGWKKAVWVFVRHAAQTERVKERLFESAVQEQQKTLPLDRVVKMSVEAASGISPWVKGEQIWPTQPAICRLCCQQLTAVIQEKIKKGETRQSREEKTDRLIKRASVWDRIMYESTSEGKWHHAGISWTRSQWHRLQEKEMIQDISSLSLCILRGLSHKWQYCRGKLTFLKYKFHLFVFCTESRLSVWIWGWALDPRMPPLEQTLGFYWLVTSNLGNIMQPFSVIYLFFRGCDTLTWFVSVVRYIMRIWPFPLNG